MDDGNEDHVLVAEYVLGLLDPEQHALLAQRIKAEPVLQREARLWQARFAGLDAQFASEPPPAKVLPAVEKRVFGEQRQTGNAGWWNSLALWRGTAMGALAVAVGAIGLNLLRPTPVDPTEFAAQLVAALQEEGSGVSFIALYDPASGAVRLTSLSGQAVPEKDYELWAIESDKPPVSMGVIRATGRSEMPVPADMIDVMESGVVFAVTLEPLGGSPTGDPTGPVVAKGAATPI